MIKGLVTIVLPVYNVKDYLYRCINSVVNQSYSNIEILLIDDGSTDGSSEICDEWAKKDDRIRVIHKVNQGLGMARNTGIENANGEYICFFDSDDFVELETIEKTYNRAVEEKADIISFGLHFADGNGRILNSFVPPLGNVNFEGEDILGFYLPELTAPNPRDNRKLFYMSSWLMLYSMDLINRTGWRFVSEREIISEDVYSLLSLFKYVNKVSVVAEPFYYYCRNESSLSRKYRADRFEKIKHFYLETVKLCEKLGYSEEIIHRVSKPYLSFAIAAMKQESVAPRSVKENRNRIKELVKDKTLQDVLKRNKKDKVSPTRKILFFSIRNKMYNICYLLLRSKANN